MDLVFVDLETTEFDPRAPGASVLEVAAVRVRAGRVIEAWSALCVPREGAVMSAEAARVNGLSLELCRAEGLTAGVWAGELRRITRGATLVAHYAPFERAWLAAQDWGAVEPLRDVLARPWLCSKAATRAADALLGVEGSTSLGPACGRYGVAYADEHTALGDATSCARLWRSLKWAVGWARGEAAWEAAVEAAREGAALELGEGR